MHHFYSYIMQKTPMKLVNWFQRYEQLKGTKNNRKQKKIFCFVWLYLKIYISDFRLILLDNITYLLSGMNNHDCFLANMKKKKVKIFKTKCLSSFLFLYFDCKGGFSGVGWVWGEGHSYLKLDIILIEKKIHVISVVFQDQAMYTAYIL